jgi:thiamine biosynthesis protein ThiI
VSRALVLHYHEIGLKRGNRLYFERRLQQNIEKVLGPGLTCHRLSGRLVVPLPEGYSVEPLIEPLKTVFGVVYFAVARLCAFDLDELKAAIEPLLERDFSTFRIHTRRSEKNLPMTSQQVNEILGAFVAQKTGKKVDLGRPDLTVFVELVQGRAFVYADRIEGPHGMPTATGGRAVALISGGIDSPVASYRIMKRGCRLSFVHFHSFPFTTRQSQDKVLEIVRMLSGYQGHSHIYWVAFAEVQKKIVALCPPEARVLFYRRVMLGVSERIARRERAHALVTGDSLGQVASQTLENLRAINEGLQLPVLRPLIGFDKEEIVDQAKRIGTYALSILPDQDCCTLFVPRHPQTRADREFMLRAGRDLSEPDLIQEALQAVTKETVNGLSAIGLPAPADNEQA